MAPTDPYWIPSLLVHAGLCPGAYSFSLVILILAGASLAPLRFWRASAVLSTATALLLIGLVGWVLRDGHHVLGDARLWVDLGTGHGLGMPAFNEFMPTRIYGLAGVLFNEPETVSQLLALCSIACGLLSALFLSFFLIARLAPPGNRPGPAVVAAILILFLQPMSFIFFGHVESYGFLALGLSFFLWSLDRDLRGKQVSRTSLVALVLLVLIHTSSLMLFPALIALWFRRKAGRRFDLIVIPGLSYAAGLLLVGLFDELRAFTVLDDKWSLHFSGDYLLGVASALTLVVFTPVLLWLMFRRRSGTWEDMSLFLVIALPPFLLLPLFVTFNLGSYGDLDLMAPAFVLTSFLVSDRLSRAITTRWTTFALCFLPGLFLLGAILSLQRCPSGLAMYERQLRSGALPVAGKVYGYEILAYHHRDRGLMEPSIQMLMEALKVQPDNRGLWGPIGNTQLALGDTASAVVSFGKSLGTTRGERYVAQFAEVLIQQREPRRAIDLLTRDPGTTLSDGGRAAALAVAYLRVSQAESSLVVSSHRIAIAPDDDLAHHNKAAALLRLGRSGEALMSFTRAAELKPDNVTYHEHVLQVMAAVSGREAALQYLNGLPSEMSGRVGERWVP